MTRDYIFRSQLFLAEKKKMSYDLTEVGECRWREEEMES